jgi:dTDP-4-amino-4,6-dideoxygalactose transaminase
MSRPPQRPIAVANPHAEFLAQADAIRDAIDRVLTSGFYILGPEVTNFETEFAQYLDVPHALGVANGTEALELALRAVGVQPGDKVATVSHTVTATATAIVEIGAEPVFIDIDPATMVMCLDALESTLATRDIKAVVPVHLYGQPVDMPRLSDLANIHQFAIVEDCAQSCGAAIGGKKTGSWGDAAAFSFYPTKNLGAIGDGGAVTTTSESVAQRLQALRQYGWQQRYISASPGRNSRLDEIQAAILRVRLPLLDDMNSTRRAHAQRYQAGLAQSSLTLPAYRENEHAIFHQYTVRSKHRDTLRNALSAQGIGTGLLYSCPVHQQPAFQTDIVLPHTENTAKQLLNLPVHPSLSLTDIDRVIATVLAHSL